MVNVNLRLVCLSIAALLYQVQAAPMHGGSDPAPPPVNVVTHNNAAQAHINAGAAHFGAAAARIGASSSFSAAGNPIMADYNAHIAVDHLQQQKFHSAQATHHMDPNFQPHMNTAVSQQDAHDSHSRATASTIVAKNAINSNNGHNMAHGPNHH